MQKIFLIISACFLLVSCGNNTSEVKKEKSSIPIIAVHPTTKDISNYVESIGTFYPSTRIEIHSQVSGMIDEIFVKEGDWVEKDAVLMKVDSRIYEIKIREAKAQIQMDRTELEAAHKKIERFRELAKRDLVAQTEWDEILTHADKAQAVLNLSEARLDMIKLELENCTIHSPIAGRVGKIDVHVSSLVNAMSSPLVTISQLNPLKVEFTVTEQELHKIPLNHPEIEIQAMCGSSFGKICARGKVTYLDSHFDSKTGQLLVRGTVPNPDLSFRPGQILKLKVSVSTDKDQLLVPQKAIRYNDEGTYVYLVDKENKVTKQQVVLGKELDNEVIVLDGIVSTDIVMTDGHLRAHPGSEVEVTL